MPWYGWLPWILLALTAISILIYFLVRKKPDLAELKADLEERDRALKDAAKWFAEEQERRKEAEKAKAELEFKFLAQQHKEKLDSLDGQEKKDYEEAKENPGSGVSYIVDFIGLGNVTSKSDKPDKSR